MDNTRKTGLDFIRLAGLGLAVALAVAASAPAPALAQDRTENCHCVDRDGNRVEGCVCLTVPSAPLQAFTLASFPRRARVGVTINYEQGPEADSEGAEISEVQPDGPAYEAGLRAGDIVVRVDGHSVFDPLDRVAERSLQEDSSVPVQRFVRLVGALEPGEPVEIEALRDGRIQRFTLTPGEPEGGLASFPGLTLFREGGGLGGEMTLDARGNLEALQERLQSQGWTTEGPGVFRFEGPGQSGAVRIFGDSLGGQGGERFFGSLRSDPCLTLPREGGQERVWVFGGNNCVDGVEFIELNPELGEYFGTSDGVLVSRVSEDSALGLRSGDVLLAVDGREVRTPEHARRVLSSYDADEEVRLRVMRKGSETEVLARRR